MFHSNTMSLIDRSAIIKSKSTGKQETRRHKSNMRIHHMKQEHFEFIALKSW